MVQTQVYNGPWRERIAKARSRLILKHPFFGTLALHLELVNTGNAAWNPTMATDGKALYINPDFLKTIDDQTLIFVVAHEVMHVALNHNTRRKKHHNPKLANIAMDYIVNDELANSGFNVPQDALRNSRFTNMAWEEVYAILEKEQKQQSKGGQGNESGKQAGASGKSDQNGKPGKSGKADKPASNDADPNTNTPGRGDPGGHGQVIEPSGDPAELEEQEAEQRIRVKQAASAAAASAGGIGKIPASIQRIVNAQKPRLNWKHMLREFIDEKNTTDYTWTRPSRRSQVLYRDTILPGTVANGIGHVIVAVDTSGSIDQPALDAFFAEINAIRSEANVRKITVIYADAKVRRVEEFDNEDITANPIGGGGTDFADTFRHIETLEPAAAILYFTDLMVNSYGVQPDAPVLWATYGTQHTYKTWSARVPWGTPIHINNN